MTKSLRICVFAPWRLGVKLFLARPLGFSQRRKEIKAQSQMNAEFCKDLRLGVKFFLTKALGFSQRRKEIKAQMEKKSKFRKAYVYLLCFYVPMW